MDTSIATTSQWTLFLVMQAISMVVLLLGIFEHARITRNHAALFAMMDRKEVLTPEHRLGVIVWFYILSTAIVTIFTFVVFIWQPHLF